MYLLNSGGEPEPADPGFAAEVGLRSGQPVGLCFQCQECTNGCPVAEFASCRPSTAVRLVQLGLRRRALAADLIWLCPGCEACAARCPNGISVRRVLDVLRGMAVAGGLVPLNHRDLVFDHLFLAGIAGRGRVAELPLLLRYKLATGGLLKDVGLGLRLLRRGKLPLRAGGVRDRAAVRRIFRVAAGAASAPEQAENPHLLRAATGPGGGW